MARRILACLAILAALAAVDAQRAPARQWGTPPAIALIDAWQAASSRLTHAGCLYTPTCSVYGELAVRRYGAYRGMWLAVGRICRCSPWGDGGEEWP
ncbi:MAG TPA: membrane protein insertion efficiency factor YidD [bacterium]|nr:membrane protein insertion efficiency factor YidD [bacterium]